MPQNFSPNTAPRYYAQPLSFRCSIGASAITTFPGSATVGGVQASATLAFSAQPAVASSITINGVAITFVASGFSLAGQLLSGTILSANGAPLPFQAVGASGLQVTIGGTLPATLANLFGLLRAWPDENLQACNYRLQVGNTILVSSRTTGTGGNAITVAATAGANVAITGATTVASGTAGSTTLTGGTAPTSGYAVLVEPQPQPVEIQTVAGICRASQTVGTMTLVKSDGTTITKSATATFASATAFSASQENSPIPFSSIAAATPLLVPPWTGVYAYGSTTQLIDIETGAGGPY